MRAKTETQAPEPGISFSVLHPAQARTKPDLAEDRQLSVIFRIQNKLFRTSSKPHTPARVSEPKASARAIPAAGRAADAAERSKLAVLKHESDFRAFVTIVLGRHEKPQDALDNLARHVRTITGQPLDFYAVFVRDTDLQPHIHLIARCQPGDATWRSLASYADPQQRQKRTTATKGRPVDLRPVDDAKGGVCGLLRYFHSRRNASPTRLKQGKASIQKSRALSRLGNALTPADIADLRQQLVSFRCDKLSHPQPANLPARHNQAQADAHPQPVYVTTYTSTEQSLRHLFVASLTDQSNLEPSSTHSGQQKCTSRSSSTIPDLTTWTSQPPKPAISLPKCCIAAPTRQTNIQAACRSKSYRPTRSIPTPRPIRSTHSSSRTKHSTSSLGACPNADTRCSRTRHGRPCRTHDPAAGRFAPVDTPRYNRHKLNTSGEEHHAGPSTARKQDCSCNSSFIA